MPQAQSQDQLAQQVQLALLARKAFKAKLAQLAPRAQSQDQQAQLVRKVFKAQLVQQAQLVRKAFKA